MFYEMNEEKVGIGELKVEQGEAVLAAYGVGSCVVIILYDTEKKIGGLAHCLLPSGNENSLKYPRAAIAKMMKDMIEMGAQPDKIIAKIIGGATMFEEFAKHEIGKRNVLQTREELNKLNIPIVGEDVFGNWGRTVFLNLSTGEVRVRSFKHGEKVL